MKLEMVTLAFNNPDQVRRTLASVALQSVAPDRHIVVDGSSPEFSHEIQQWTEKAGAEYHWRKPSGVYPAMNDALAEISSESFVWFLNSSDWLASPKSVATARDSLKKDFHWAVGGLHRYRDVREPFHPSPENAASFVTALCSGRIGFPHPSTIMSKTGIDRSGGFGESYQIAGDYALALRFAAKHGAPQMIPDVLTIHDPTGLTSRRKVLHLIEKVRARRKSGVTLGAELAALFGLARAYTTPSAKRPRGRVLDKVLPAFSWNNLELPWPEGCLGILDSWGA